MPEQPIVPITSVENPQTLREVGIHLGTLSKALEDIKIIEAKHHSENVARNEAILKKLDDMNDSHPNRSEFNEMKDKVKTLETNTSDINIIRGLVYGCAGIMLTAIIVGLVYLVINH